MVPSVAPTQFGSRFSEWWMSMQPGWRKDGGRSITTLVLFRDTPLGETWQGLKKGGTAGIYVIVLALSWWIKAQLTECNPMVWSAVEDVSWVVQQMKNNMVSHVPSKKRARDDDGEEKTEGQLRKR